MADFNMADFGEQGTPAMPNTPEIPEEVDMEKAVPLRTEDLDPHNEPLKVFTHQLGSMLSDTMDGIYKIGTAVDQQLKRPANLLVNSISKAITGKEWVKPSTSESRSQAVADAEVPIAEYVNSLMGGEKMPTKDEMKAFVDDRGDFTDMPLSEEIAYGVGGVMSLLPTMGTGLFSKVANPILKATGIGAVNAGVESGVMSIGAGDDTAEVIAKTGAGFVVGGAMLGTLTVGKNLIGKDVLSLTETTKHTERTEKILHDSAIEANPNYVKDRDSWVQASVFDTWDEVPILDRLVYSASHSKTGEFVLDSLATSKGLIDKQMSIKAEIDSNVKDTIIKNTPDIGATAPIKVTDTKTLAREVPNSENRAIKLQDFIQKSVSHPETVTYEAMKDIFKGSTERVDKIQAILNKVEKQGFTQLATQAKDAHISMAPSDLLTKLTADLPQGSKAEMEIMKTALARSIGVDLEKIGTEKALVDINAGHIIETFMELPNVSVSNDMSLSPNYQVMRDSLTKLLEDIAPGTGASQTLKNITKTVAAKNRVMDAVVGGNGTLDATLLRGSEIHSLYRRMMESDKTKTFDEFASMFPKEQRREVELGLIRSTLDNKTAIDVNHMDTAGSVSNQIMKSLEGIKNEFKTKEAKGMMKYLEYTTGIARNLDRSMGLQRNYKSTGERDTKTLMWEYVQKFGSKFLTDETYIKNSSILDAIAHDVGKRVHVKDTGKAHTLNSTLKGNHITDGEMAVLSHTSKLSQHIADLNDYSDVFMGLPKVVRKSVFVDGGTEFPFLHITPEERAQVAQVAQTAYAKYKGDRSKQFAAMHEARKAIDMTNSTFGYAMDRDGHMAWDVNLPGNYLKTVNDTTLELGVQKESLMKGIMGVMYDNEKQLVKEIKANNLNDYKILIKKGDSDSTSMNGDTLTITLSDFPKAGKDLNRDAIGRKASSQLRQMVDSFAHDASGGMGGIIQRLNAVSNVGSGGL